MQDIKMEAAIFFDSYFPRALRRALQYAGDDGFVASMPQLLHARANASYDHTIWNTWFTPNSEENVVKTPQGNRVVVAVHGGGMYGSPERFERVYRQSVDQSNPEGLTGQFTGKITERESRDVLEGKLPDGTEIPVYPFEEFKQGIADLPIRYGVILDFEMARKANSGYETFEALKDDPNLIVRAGGVEAAAAYLDKYCDRYNTKVMGNWHPYNGIDPDQPQTRILFLAGNKDGEGSDEGDDHPFNYDTPFGYDTKYGLSGKESMFGMSRYVAVAPRDVSTDLRYLDFEL
ncbi:MAG: hypothetical protein IIB54_14650 [Planctomycetes bacterium]|nr:hypothetical protein [Planctomycetota bacterium]